jgi:hypothetical protein
MNHVRTCVNCRVALAREENLAADLRREMPLFGQASAGQLAQVWAGVWQDVGTPRSRPQSWLPGLGAVLAMLLLMLIAVPLLMHGGIRAEAAPMQVRPTTMVATASPTVGVTDEAISLRENPTVAYMVWSAAASPVPVPGATTSPEARIGGLFSR